jgi:hypothetical protein
MQSLADQVPPIRRDVGVALAKDLYPFSASILTCYAPQKQHAGETHHNQFALDIPCPEQAVVVLPLAKCPAMDISGKETHGSTHALIESAAVRQMAAQAHASGPDSTVACWESQEIVHAEGCILVVCSDFLIWSVRCCSGHMGNLRERDLTLATFHWFPLSVSSASYFNGSGPVNSW